MGKILLPLLFFFQPVLVNAQSRTVDSLQRLLAQEREDTSRVPLLNQLSAAYLYNRPDTALALSQQALLLSRKNAFKKGEAESLGRIGNSFMVTSNYEKALKMHLASLQLAEKTNDLTRVQGMLTNIGIDYGLQGDNRHGVIYTLKALELARQLNDQRSIGSCLANLGHFYENMHMLDSARMYTNMGYDLGLKLNYGSLLGITLNNLGNIYSKMGQDAVAMANYNMSLPFYQREDDIEGLSESYLGMARLFQRAGRPDSGLYYAKLSLMHAKELGSTTRMMDASAFLTAYYSTIKNVDSAFAYQSATMAAKDSLFSQEKLKQIQNLTFDETMRQQELAFAKAEEETERSNNLQFAVIAIGIISFIMLSFLLSRTVIVNERWISFFGVLGLLLFFEFINLFIHPYIGELTHHSPLYMLLIMVGIASLLIPLHHKIEHKIKEKMVVKNRKIRLAAAKKTVAELENNAG